MCRTGVHVVMLRTHQWSGPVQPAALCSPSVWRRTKQLTKVIYRTALQTTTWVSSQESFCSLFQLQVIHTTLLETALQRSVSIVTAQSHHTGTAQLVVRNGLVHSGREPASTVSQGLSAYSLSTFVLPDILTARPWQMTVPSCEKKGGPLCLNE